MNYNTFFKVITENNKNIISYGYGPHYVSFINLLQYKC